MWLAQCHLYGRKNTSPSFFHPYKWIHHQQTASCVIFATMEKYSQNRITWTNIARNIFLLKLHAPTVDLAVILYSKFTWRNIWSCIVTNVTSRSEIDLTIINTKLWENVKNLNNIIWLPKLQPSYSYALGMRPGLSRQSLLFVLWPKIHKQKNPFFYSHDLGWIVMITNSSNN